MIDLYSGPIINISLIAVLLLFNSLYLKKKFDLVFLFVNIHLCTLIFYFFFQSYFLKPMNYSFFIIVLLYTAGFTAGYFLHYAINGKVKISRQWADISCRRLFFYNSLGFVIFVLAFIYELFHAGWVPPIFAENKLLAYYDFPQEFVHYLVVSGIPISGVYAYIAERYRYKRRLIYTIIIVINLIFVAQLARAIITTQIFTVIYIYFRENNIRLTWSKLAWFTVSLLGLITFLGTIRTSDEVDTLLAIGGMKNWPTWSLPFAWIYLYFTTSLENMRHIAAVYSGDYRYGILSFLTPLGTLFQMKNHHLFLIDLGPKSAGGFNTAGYYLPVFLDFGYLGYLYTAFLGYVSRYLMNTGKLYFYLFSSFWLYCIFTSSVNDYFNQFFTMVYLAYYIVVVAVSKK